MADDAPHADVDDLKRAAAVRAVDDEVRPGMVVGLGTGSTAIHATRRIGELLAAGELSGITGVPTAVETEAEARTGRHPAPHRRGPLADRRDHRRGRRGRSVAEPHQGWGRRTPAREARVAGERPRGDRRRRLEVLGAPGHTVRAPGRGRRLRPGDDAPCDRGARRHRRACGAVPTVARSAPTRAT